MKAIIVYSSLTGNTKMVAEAIHTTFKDANIDCDIFSIKEAPAPDAYDLVCPGYWVDKGMPDAACCKYMETIKGKKVAPFGTLGAYPDSDHGKSCLSKAEELASRNGENEVVGSFLCMGKVDPKLVEMMQKMAQAQHPMTPERKARLEEGKNHPNEEDLKNARGIFAKIISNL